MAKGRKAPPAHKDEIIRWAISSLPTVPHIRANKFPPNEVPLGVSFSGWRRRRMVWAEGSNEATATEHHSCHPFMYLCFCPFTSYSLLFSCFIFFFICCTVCFRFSSVFHHHHSPKHINLSICLIHFAEQGTKQPPRRMCMLLNGCNHLVLLLTRFVYLTKCQYTFRPKIETHRQFMYVPLYDYYIKFRWRHSWAYAAAKKSARPLIILRQARVKKAHQRREREKNMNSLSERNKIASIFILHNKQWKRAKYLGEKK